MAKSKAGETAKPESTLPPEVVAARAAERIKNKELLAFLEGQLKEFEEKIRTYLTDHILKNLHDHPAYALESHDIISEIGAKLQARKQFHGLINAGLSLDEAYGWVQDEFRRKASHIGHSTSVTSNLFARAYIEALADLLDPMTRIRFDRHFF